MASSIKTITIDKVGNNIEILVNNPSNPNTPEVYPVSKIIGVSSVKNIGIGRNGIDNPTTYPFTDMLVVIMSLSGDDSTDIRFDIQTVSNQVGWTANFAGLQQAITDIKGWL